MSALLTPQQVTNEAFRMARETRTRNISDDWLNRNHNLIALEAHSRAQTEVKEPETRYVHTRIPRSERTRTVFLPLFF